MSDHEVVIKKPAGARLSLLREEYLAICDGDFAAAKLLNAIERWHLYKLKAREQARASNRVRRQGGLSADQDDALWVRMAIESKQPGERTWSGELLGEYSYKPLSRALTLLEEKGYVSRRGNPRQTWDRTPQWLLNVKVVQAAVDEWEARRAAPDFDSFPDGTIDEDDSVDSTESTRQKDRVESGKTPSGVGQNAESTRSKDRSNNTEVLHRNPSQTFTTGGVIPLNSDARANTPNNTTTEENLEDQEDDPLLDALLGGDASAPSAEGAEAPTSHAAPSQKLPSVAQVMSNNATTLQKVPRAAAVASSNVKSVLERYFGGGDKGLDAYLHLTPGGLDRRDAWFNLEATFVDQEGQRARAFVKAHATPKPSLRTVLAAILDIACGAELPNPYAALQPGATPSAPAEPVKVNVPFAVHDRVCVDGVTGLVTEINRFGIVIDPDGDDAPIVVSLADMHDVQKIEAQAAPREVTKWDVGQRWHHKDTPDVVHVITERLPRSVRLDDNREVTLSALAIDYRHAPA